VASSALNFLRPVVGISIMDSQRILSTTNVSLGFAKEEGFFILLLCSFDASRTLETQRSEHNLMSLIGVKALQLRRTVAFFIPTPSSGPAE
jgi:hypothetical protein